MKEKKLPIFGDYLTFDDNPAKHGFSIETQEYFGKPTDQRIA